MLDTAFNRWGDDPLRAIFREGVKGTWPACDPLTPSRKILSKILGWTQQQNPD